MAVGGLKAMVLEGKRSGLAAIGRMGPVMGGPPELAGLPPGQSFFRCAPPLLLGKGRSENLYQGMIAIRSGP